MNEPHRRQFLVGTAATILCGAVPGVSLASDELEAERHALLAHMRERMLGFDVGEVALRVVDALEAPQRYRDAVAEIFAGHDLSEGVRSVRTIGDIPDLSKGIENLVEQFGGDLRAKLFAVRTLKKAPQTDEKRQALLDQIYGFFDLDMERIRAHVASYPTEDLAICWGPVLSLSELGAFLAREPFALYLQLAHGTRARQVWGSSPAEATDLIVDVLLDPEIRRVAFCGHGIWSTFSLSGYFRDPDTTYTELCSWAADDPKDLLKRLARGNPHYLWERTFQRGELREEDLAPLADQFLPDEADRRSVNKDLIVRYTCGSHRYGVEGRLLLTRLPDDLVEKLNMGHEAFTRGTPTSDPTWADHMRSWLADKQVVVKEATAFGTSFARSPDATRGYDGLSWIDDFFADPLPPLIPAESFGVIAPLTPAPPMDSAESDDDQVPE